MTSTGIERAQLGDIELMTQYPDKTTQDTVSEIRYLNYVLPPEDVFEIFSVIAEGITSK